MSLFSTAEARLVDLEARVAALEGAEPPVDPPEDPPIVVGPDTITVSTTLQAAIDAAPSGAQVYVPSGTWSGQVNLAGKHDITLYGDGVDSIVKCDSASEWIVMLPENGGQANIEFRDFNIVGNPAQYGQKGIAVEECDGLSIHHMTFTSIGYKAVELRTYPYDQWEPFKILNVELNDNVVTHSGSHGFYVGAGVSGCNVRRNTFGGLDMNTGEPPHAVYIQDAVHVWCEYNEARDIPWSNGFAYKVGVQTEAGHVYDVHINYNKSTNCYGGLWVVSAKDVYAAGNEFLTCTNDAVQLFDKCEHIVLDGNTLGPLYWAIRCIGSYWGATQESVDVQLTNNQVVSGVNGYSAADGVVTVDTGNSWD